MKHFRTALLIGAIVLPACMLVGCGGGAKQRSGIDQNIQNAKMFVKDLKEGFAAGQLEKKTEGAREGQARPDARMTILTFAIKDKIRATIQKRETDAQKRDKALAQLKKSEDYLMNEIGPKYQEAVRTKKAEDIQALVPLMEELDKQLDELNNILNS